MHPKRPQTAQTRVKKTFPSANEGHRIPANKQPNNNGGRRKVHRATTTGGPCGAISPHRKYVARAKNRVTFRASRVSTPAIGCRLWADEGPFWPADG